MNREVLRSFLDQKAAYYNQQTFIETDPVQVPHRFSRKENIEIIAFITASIAWGNRQTIIRNALLFAQRLDNDPHGFIMQATDEEIRRAAVFVHRTFNAGDAAYFLFALRNIWQRHSGLEAVFTKGYHQNQTIKGALNYFRKVFFELPAPESTYRHVAHVEAGSAAKRLNMFLRWMVRKDKSGVDFGLWSSIPPSTLMLPLDVHTGNVARKLGLLIRKQNDWKAVEEVSSQLRDFDPADPVKYDFALFGLGAFEKF